MFAVPTRSPQSTAGLLLSAAAHTALLGLLALIVLYARPRPIVRTSRCCATTLDVSGNLDAGAALAVPAAAPTPRHLHHRAPRVAAAAAHHVLPLPTAHTTPEQPGLPAPRQQATLGDGTGADDAEPALPSWFPSPAVPDRSLLPTTAQNIVVEVSVSAGGDVTQEKLVQGLGNALDQIVLNTVRTWRFHPATLNGAAVASIEDLVFPFRRDSPGAGPSTSPSTS